MSSIEMKPLKALIVDDEWLVRHELQTMLQAYPEIQVIGEASDVNQASCIIDEENPDVIFLDIEMPGKNGFDLIEQCNIKCSIIFVTAYNQYAIRAFEVNAIDYLLKPIQKDRLALTINRILKKEKARPVIKKVLYDDVIYVMIDGSVKFIKLPLLKCIVAEGNYSYIFYDQNRKELVSKTLLDWEKILPSQYFIRIHRSTIVNFEYVAQVRKCNNNTHEVYIQGIEKPFMMSRRYAARLKDQLTW